MNTEQHITYSSLLAQENCISVYPRLVLKGPLGKREGSEKDKSLTHWRFERTFVRPVVVGLR